MEFHLEADVIDVIEKGDLLTVLKDEGDAYLVITFDGHQGLVDKVNALRLAEAVEVYNELINDHPETGRFHTLRASAWWARQEEEKALADFDEAIELGYQEPEAYSSRGLFHAALGNFDKAIADYTTAIERGAEDEAPYINRAAVHMSQQNYDAAIEDYTRAIRIRANSPTVYQQRAVAYKLKDDLDAAIADFDAALKIDDKFIPALMGRGYLRFQQQQHEQAIANFTRVIELEPEAVQAYNNRGYNRQMLGDYADALADYDEAIRLAPEFALVYQNKAWLLATADDESIRNGSAAIAAATKACELNNYEHVADVKALAAAFAAYGRFDKAIGWQEKAIELAAEEQKEFENMVLDRYRGEMTYPTDLPQAEVPQENTP
jgi:tetratricopeptide (TPR) repeat protein